MNNFSLGFRIRNAWNAFMNRDPTKYIKDIGPGYSYRPDRMRMLIGNERSIMSSIYTRIGIDVSGVPLQHVRSNEEGFVISEVDSGINRCLRYEANRDQSGKAFIQDVVMSLCDEGQVAIVPIDTSADPLTNEKYDIYSVRTAKIIEWYPDHVRLSVYNDRSGEHEDMILPKRVVALLENPFYSVMNEPNSTSRRLIRKLNLLDTLDEELVSGKLDLIVQLPYPIRYEKQKKIADLRRKDFEDQLRNSKYGIAYIDGVEKIVQLNRPVENNLMSQIEYLTDTLYGQLGITQKIFSGTASESERANYYGNTVYAFSSVIASELDRKFLDEDQRKNRESIQYCADIFKFISPSYMHSIVNSFKTNEIMSSNEIRRVIGYKYHSEEEANRLENPYARGSKGTYIEDYTSQKEDNDGSKSGESGI